MASLDTNTESTTICSICADDIGVRYELLFCCETGKQICGKCILAINDINTNCPSRGRCPGCRRNMPSYLCENSDERAPEFHEREREEFNAAIVERERELDAMIGIFDREAEVERLEATERRSREISERRDREISESLSFAERHRRRMRAERISAREVERVERMSFAERHRHRRRMRAERIL